MIKLNGFWYKEAQYRWDNCQISQSDCRAKIHKNVTRPCFLLSGLRLGSEQLTYTTYL